MTHLAEDPALKLGQDLFHVRETFSAEKFNFLLSRAKYATNKNASPKKARPKLSRDRFSELRHRVGALGQSG